MLKLAVASIFLMLGALAQDSSAVRWGMPDEGQPHNRTWMAFPSNRDIWGKQLSGVQKNIATIAAAIAQFEPVYMLVSPDAMSKAQSLVGNGVTLVADAVDDLWMRDTGPVFVNTNGSVGGINFNFNGWGNKQKHGNDSLVAAEVNRAADKPVIPTRLVLEGGALEVDGEGTAIITESCVLNTNRNPGWSKEAVTAELSRLLNLTKIIWLPGMAGKDITDGHTDFYARFSAPGQVFAGYEPDTTSFDHNVTLTHLDILRNSTDAMGRSLNVTVLTAPTTTRKATDSEDAAVGYINFYTCNGGVIVPQFGDDKADQAAQVAIQAAYPGRKVVALNIDQVAAGGGGIHCTTQQEPAFGGAVGAGTGTGNATAADAPSSSAAASSSGAGRRRRGGVRGFLGGLLASALYMVL